MATIDQTLRDCFALLLVLWALAHVTKEREPVRVFTFEPPSPSALDQLSQELGAIGQAAWYRQQEAGSTTSAS